MLGRSTWSHCQAGPLRVIASNQPLRCILTIVSWQFNLRAVVHPIGLYKKKQTPRWPHLTNAHKWTPKYANKNGNPGPSKGKNKCKGPHKPRGANVKGNNSKSKDKSTTCIKCGCYNYPTKKCHTPMHLVELYLHSVGCGCSNQGGQQS